MKLKSPPIVSDATSMDETSTLITVLVSVSLIVVAGPLIARRLLTNKLHGSAAKQQQGEQLKQTGAKGRATVLSTTPTGTVINRVMIECRIQFRIEPLFGGVAFDGEKTAFIPQPQIPRPGDVWPCWYDTNDTTLFVVGLPDPSQPEAQQVLEDFGISNPLTRVLEGADAGSSTMIEASSTIEALAHQSTLRAQGVIDEAQFVAAAKQLA